MKYTLWETFKKPNFKEILLTSRWGKCANIPKCCRRFYFLYNNPDYINYHKWYYGEINKLYQNGFYIGYTPCPDCFRLKRFNIMKICPENKLDRCSECFL